MGEPHQSGICVYKDCDKPSVIEGYCPFHYNVIIQQEQRKSTKVMIELLCSMNNRLEYIEEQIKHPPTQNQQTPIKPQSQPTPQSEHNQIKKKDTHEERPGFVPSVNVSGHVTLEGIKTTHGEKNVQDLARQLGNIGDHHG